MSCVRLNDTHNPVGSQCQMTSNLCRYHRCQYDVISTLGMFAVVSISSTSIRRHFDVGNVCSCLQLTMSNDVEFVPIPSTSIRRHFDVGNVCSFNSVCNEIFEKRVEIEVLNS